MVKVAVVTCTVGRPELFALCERYVERQTRPIDEWVIQTDDLEPFPNLAIALTRVSKDHHVVIMEDDDWYAPNHVDNMLVELEQGKRISSCTPTRRYNFPARRYHSKHMATAGGAMMSIHRDYVSEYAAIIGRKYDGQWRGDREAWERNPDLVPSRPSTLVQMKGVGYGLPGLKGQTSKHRPEFVEKVRRWTYDPNLTVLTEWIGSDVENYLALMETV